MPNGATMPAPNGGTRTRSSRAYARKCECTDSRCSAVAYHKGWEPMTGGIGSTICDRPSKVTLYRADMDDQTGVKFCYECAADAMCSGIFGG